MAKTSRPPISTYFYNLVNSQDPAVVAKADKAISENTLLHAIMRNTIAPVFLPSWISRKRDSGFGGRDAPVTPYLFQAGTDAIAWRSHGVPVYGIHPYPISDDDLSRMHGNNERMSIRSLDKGVQTARLLRPHIAGRAKRSDLDRFPSVVPLEGFVRRCQHLASAANAWLAPLIQNQALSPCRQASL